MCVLDKNYLYRCCDLIGIIGMRTNTEWRYIYKYVVYNLVHELTKTCSVIHAIMTNILCIRDAVFGSSQCHYSLGENEFANEVEEARWGRREKAFTKMSSPVSTSLN